MDTTGKPARPEATLYYDGHCPLCRREMARLGEHRPDQLRLVDIHELGETADLPGRDTLLRTLHLQLSDGQLLTGVDANVTAWRYAGRGNWLAWLRWPLVRPLADLCYGFWARWRYRRLYGRRDGRAGGAGQLSPPRPDQAHGLRQAGTSAPNPAGAGRRGPKGPRHLIARAGLSLTQNVNGFRTLCVTKEVPTHTRECTP